MQKVVGVLLLFLVVSIVVLLYRADRRQAAIDSSIAEAEEALRSSSAIATAAASASLRGDCPIEEKTEAALYEKFLDVELAISRLERTTGPGHYSAQALRRRGIEISESFSFAHEECARWKQKQRAKARELSAQRDMLLTRRSHLLGDIEVVCAAPEKEHMTGRTSGGFALYRDAAVLCREKKAELAEVQRALARP